MVLDDFLACGISIPGCAILDFEPGIFIALDGTARTTGTTGRLVTVKMAEDAAPQNHADDAVCILRGLYNTDSPRESIWLIYFGSFMIADQHS